MPQPPKPLTIVYGLIIQCVRPHIGIIAEYTSATPFPEFKGKHLELTDCDPSTWDVHDAVVRVMRHGDALFITTLLLVDSPVLDNRDRRPLSQEVASYSEVSAEDEELIKKSIEIIRQEKRASTSLLQRRLRLGYTRAARIINILESRGILGPGEGAGPRQILIDL
jgi:DNA segregation ATPase FtsK/SpoIIIE-like protein